MIKNCKYENVIKSFKNNVLNDTLAMLFSFEPPDQFYM